MIMCAVHVRRKLAVLAETTSQLHTGTAGLTAYVTASSCLAPTCRRSAMQQQQGLRCHMTIVHLPHMHASVSRVAHVCRGLLAVQQHQGDRLGLEDSDRNHAD